MIPDVVVYHGCCSDGFGSMYVCKKKWVNEDIQYVAQNFKKESFELNNLEYEYKDKKILFVDFVYDEEKLISDLEKETKQLLIIDHHKSAYEKYKDKDYAFFDQTKSASVLTWEHCFPELKVPLILQYVQDRDLRNFNMPFVYEVLSVLDEKYNKTVEDWDRFSYELENNFEQVVKLGEEIIKTRNVKIKNLSKDSKNIEIKGVVGEIAYAENWDLASDVADELAKKSNFGFSWFKNESGEIKCSLRSNNGTNVRLLAECIGGGGHDNSAGATLSEKDIEKLINNSFFIDKNLKENIKNKIKKANKLTEKDNSLFLVKRV